MSVDLAMLRTLLRLSALQTSRMIRAAPSEKLGQDKIMELMNAVALSTLSKMKDLVASVAKSVKDSPVTDIECGEVAQLATLMVLEKMTESVEDFIKEYKAAMPE